MNFTPNLLRRVLKSARGDLEKHLNMRGHLQELFIGHVAIGIKRILFFEVIKDGLLRRSLLRSVLAGGGFGVFVDFGVGGFGIVWVFGCLVDGDFHRFRSGMRNVLLNGCVDGGFHIILRCNHTS